MWRSLLSVDGEPHRERMTIPYHSMQPQTPLAYPGAPQYQQQPPGPPAAPASSSSSFPSNTLPTPSQRTIYSSLTEATNGFFYNHNKQHQESGASPSSQIRKSLTNSDHQQQQPSHHPASQQSFQSFHNFAQSPAAGLHHSLVHSEQNFKSTKRYQMLISDLTLQFPRSPAVR